MSARLLGWLLADGRRRWTGLVALAVLLAVGARYAWFSMHQPRGWRWCRDHPPACDGRPVYLSLWEVTALRPNGYDLYKTYGPVPVTGDPAGLRVGDTVSVTARFDAEGPRLVEQDREVHVHRRAKRALGYAGIALLAGLCAVGFRRTPEGWVVRG